MGKVVDKLRVKKAWVEVSLPEWMEMGLIGADKKLIDLNFARRMKTIAIISNRTEEQIDEYGGENLANILAATSFLDKPPAKRRVKWFTLSKAKDATKYIFHPKPNELSAGEIISIEQLMIDEKNNPELNTFADIITILFRPCTKVWNEEFKKDIWTIEKFDTKNLDDRKKLFLKRLTVDKFYNEMVFFSTIGEKSRELSHLSTLHQKMVQRM